MSDSRKRRALGRGLDALIPSAPRAPQAAIPPSSTDRPAIGSQGTQASEPAQAPDHASGQQGSSLPVNAEDAAAAVPAIPPPPAIPAPESIAAPKRDGNNQGFLAKIEELHQNREQPRTRFEDERLEELAASIRELGVLEPILVRKRSQGGYEIVAGERRWRAAQRAGLHEVPVFVRELTEEKAFEAALVENLQREDLNPLETARAFQRLVDDYGQSQEEVARRIGKDRSTVANALRLLKLPTPVIDLLESRDLSEGHGRAILGAGDVAAMIRLAKEAVAEGWSVRETERRARLAAAPPPPTPDAAPAEKSANIRDLEQRLSRSMGTRVEVNDRKGKGHLKLAYSSLDELDRLLRILMP